MTLGNFEYFADGVTGLWTRCVRPLDFYVGKCFEFFANGVTGLYTRRVCTLSFLGLKGVFIKILLGVKLVAILFKFGIFCEQSDHSR